MVLKIDIDNKPKPTSWGISTKKWRWSHIKVSKAFQLRVMTTVYKPCLLIRTETNSRNIAMTELLTCWQQTSLSVTQRPLHRRGEVVTNVASWKLPVVTSLRAGVWQRIVVVYWRFGRTCCLRFQGRRKIVCYDSSFGKITKNCQHNSWTDTGRDMICYVTGTVHLCIWRSYK